MTKKIILIIYLITWTNLCLAFDLDTNFWNDFEGKLNKMEIKLSLFRFDDGQLKGNYCYKKYEERIQLIGKIKGNNIELQEIIGGKYKGSFKGKISTNGPDLFIGTWTYGSQILNFKLSLNSICGGGYEHRYDDFDGGDIDVENFMKKVKVAILKGNKEWLANHVYFPIEVDINKRNVSIKNKRKFVDNFDIIFYEKFKDKIKSFCVCNMFNNSHGVMLGNGEIWINQKSFSAENEVDFNIIAINN